MTGRVSHVSDSALPPEQWRPLFDKIGVDFGYRPLATRIGMDHTRLRRLLLGGGTSAAAIQELADAFKVTPDKIREMRAEQLTHYEPFTLPDDAGRLNHNERDVIRAMVRALLDARGERNDAVEDPQKSSTSTQAGSPQEGGAKIVRRDDWGRAGKPKGGESEKRAAAKRKPGERPPKDE